MKEHIGPYYTFDEAMQKLSLTPSELDYALREGDIEAVLRSSARKIILIQITSQGDYVGLAHCTFRGVISTSRFCVMRILDDGFTHINNEAMRIVKKDSFSNWNTQNPYKSAYERLPLVDWAATEFSNLPEPFNAICLIDEKASISREITLGITNMLKLTPQNEAKQSIIEKNENLLSTTPLYELDSWEHSRFDKVDLLISASEIKRYLSTADVTPTPSEHQVDLDCAELKRQRHSNINQVILRLIQHNPTDGTHALWGLLRKDYLLDEPRYDTDNIIQKIDTHSLEWKSIQGTMSELKYNSFRTKLSKLKREIREQ